MKISVLMALVASTLLGQQTPTFNSRTDITANLAVVIGDFNKDGIEDAVLESRSGLVQIFFGNGDGTFLAGPTSPDARLGLYSNVAVDMNGDGNLDIVTLGVGVCLGNGDGTFQPCVLTATAAQCNNIAVADMNGDGSPDVVAATNSGIEIFLNQGDGSFAAPTTLFGSVYMNGVGVADLNGDGVPDIVALYDPKSGCPCGILVLLATQGGYTAAQEMAVPYNPGQIVFADFNRDGRTDMAVGPGPVSVGSTIDVFFGSGAGTFSKPLAVADLNGITSLAVGDVNGDGVPDLVVGDSNVTVYLGKGNGGFEAGQVSEIGSVALSITLSPLRKPGLLDIVTSNVYTDSVSVLLNQGSGAFHEDVHFPVANSTGIPIVADFNGDGLDDFAEMTSTGISVYLNTGNLKAPFTLSATLTAALSYAMEADINGDGLPDLVVALTDGDVEIFPGLGNGQFGTPVLTHTGITVLSGQVFQIAAADINGDGKIDLLGTTNFKLIGNGDFTFQSPAPIWGTLGEDTNFVYTITPVDLNRDGKIDAVLGIGTGSGGIITLLNTGGGNFAPKADDLELGATYQVAAGDFNGDGIPDVTFIAESVLWVYLGNGDGTMSEAPNYLIPAVSTGGIAIGDFNGDGKIDISFSAADFAYCEVFLGNGDGTFQVPSIDQPEFAWGVYQGNDYAAAGNFRKPFTQKFPDIIITTYGGVDILYNTTK